MQDETIASLTARIGTIQWDVGDIRRIVGLEQLTSGQRLYAARCLDLLDLELTALRQFLASLNALDPFSPSPREASPDS